MQSSELQPLGVSADHIIEGEKESANELMTRLCVQVSGVGPATARAIVDVFDGNVQAFLATSFEHLSQLMRPNGRRLLNDNQITELLEKIGLLPKQCSLAETWVFYLGRQFLLNQVKMVEDLDFKGFDINPLLAKALSLDTPRKVITFNVYQTVTRSVVTSWGDTVEEIARFVGCRKNDYTIEGKTGTNFDLKKTVQGTDYYIQVKSGPNTMNVGMVTSLNEAIEKIEDARPHSKGILGMTYGRKNRISNQITANLNDADARMKIGREFWDFISEKSGFHGVLFAFLDKSADGILEHSFIELIDAKINALEAEWAAHAAGKNINAMLENYL